MNRGRESWTIRKLPSGSWLGVCDSLSITLEADSESELKSTIDEAVDALLSGPLDLHFQVTADEEGILSAFCDEVPGLMTGGQTREQVAKEMIPDAIVCWYEGCRKLGISAVTVTKVDVDAPPAPQPITARVLFGLPI